MALTWAPDLDLAEPDTIAESISGLGAVSRLVLSSIARDNNPVREYTIADAIHLTTMKLVGYTTTVHALIDRFSEDSSVVLFGGRAKDRPYPGSTVTTVWRCEQPHSYPGHRAGAGALQRHPSRNRRR